MLNHLTFSVYTVKDSFDFSEEIFKQNSDLFMANLEITSLFTNIPLDETKNIFLYESFANNQFLSNFCQVNFETLRQLTTKESFFIFDKNFS